MLKNLSLTSVLHKKTIQQLLQWHFSVSGGNNVWIAMLILRQFSCFEATLKKAKSSSVGNACGAVVGRLSFWFIM